MQLRINPSILFVEPDAAKALLTPARGIRFDELLGRTRREEFTGRSKLEVFALACRATEKRFKKEWSFKPPMPEELGVEWTNDNRIFESHGGQLAEAYLTFRKKIIGVLIRHSLRHGRIVRLFLTIWITNPIVFEAGEFSNAVWTQEGMQFLLRPIETKITVKIAVEGMTGITAFGAPDFAIRFRVARKRCRTSRGVDRCIDGKERSR